jgi:hypothetical protein
MSDYDFNDFFSTSPIERQRNIYRQVIRDTERSIHKIRTDREKVIQNRDFQMTLYHCSGDTSQGQIVTAFEDALGRWETTLNELADSSGLFYAALSALEAKLDILRARLATLNDLCTLEDSNKKELSLSDIIFED